jgi:predicted acetyltransferase
MAELVTPAERWMPEFRQALVESAPLGDAAPWDPAPDCTDEAMASAIADMAKGIWGPQATEPTQLLRWWVEGDIYLGRASLRHLSLRDSDPAHYAGHGDIGYDVRPSARGRGIATEILRAMLDLARELGYPDVLVTCDVGNAASRRVIEKAGGRFVDEFDDAGESVLRYRFPL